MSKLDAKILRESLADVGGLTLQDESGRSLYIVLNRNLGIEKKGALVAYEGRGSMFFEMDRPLNKFRLLKAGFPAGTADIVSGLVNTVFFGEAEPEIHDPKDSIEPPAVKLIGTSKD